jgi:N-acylneuraminate cytidylyltransferase
MASSVAIIPARGGSKRIPRKNIRPFVGVPAIQRTIKIAKESGLFSEILVTTDDTEIAELSSKSGAKVIERPPQLADDNTATVPVIAHALEQYLTNFGIESVETCCIYPVNPFLEINDLKNGLEIMRLSSGVSYVLPVCSYPYPIQRAVILNEDDVTMLQPENALTRSQDLVEVFHDAGQWYWGNSKAWMNQDKLLFNSKAIRIPRWRCQDIDTEEDWKTAELMYSAYEGNLQNKTYLE